MKNLFKLSSGNLVVGRPTILSEISFQILDYVLFLDVFSSERR